MELLPIIQKSLFAVMGGVSFFTAIIILGFLIILIGKCSLNDALNSMSTVAFKSIMKYPLGSAAYVIIVIIHTGFLCEDMSYMLVWRWIFLVINWTVIMLAGIALKKTGKLYEL